MMLRGRVTVGCRPGLSGSLAVGHVEVAGSSVPEASLRQPLVVGGLARVTSNWVKIVTSKLARRTTVFWAHGLSGVDAGLTGRGRGRATLSNPQHLAVRPVAHLDSRFHSLKPCPAVTMVLIAKSQTGAAGMHATNPAVEESSRDIDRFKSIQLMVARPAPQPCASCVRATWMEDADLLIVRSGLGVNGALAAPTAAQDSNSVTGKSFGHQQAVAEHAKCLSLKHGLAELRRVGHHHHVVS
mmetsp:Transcript_46380/g.83723  ORF Transcript_46380/g.83723 Transcript_46380/m.83723 type:complete len:241 (+) Transcript_46380:2064-2786(+)